MLKLITGLSLNHYFDSIYLISSSKSSIPHNRHVSTIYVLKVKKNVLNLRYATRLTKIKFYHRTARMMSDLFRNGVREVRVEIAINI